MIWHLRRDVGNISPYTIGAKMSDTADDWAVAWSFLNAAQERVCAGVRAKLSEMLGAEWAASPRLPHTLEHIRTLAEGRFVRLGRSPTRMTRTQFRRAWRVVEKMVLDATAEERTDGTRPLTLRIFEG